MSIFDDARNAANEIMAEFGHGVIQYVGVTTTEGVRPDKPASTVDNDPITVKGIARPVSTKYLSGTSIVESDREVVITNDGSVTPNMSGHLLIDGVKYKIVSVLPRPASGDPISWTLIVRR